MSTTKEGGVIYYATTGTQIADSTLQSTGDFFRSCSSSTNGGVIFLAHGNAAVTFSSTNADQNRADVGALAFVTASKSFTLTEGSFTYNKGGLKKVQSIYYTAMGNLEIT